jgi:hypothetical protein
MFRDENIAAQNFMVKFEQLKKKFDEKEVMHLDSEYHQQLQVYIERVYSQTCLLEGFDDKVFYAMREAEMSNLNRLQKLKNGSSYKKDKHKSKRQNEDWG